jgi:hypothetical protein
MPLLEATLGKRPWTTWQLVTCKPVYSKRHFHIERNNMKLTCRLAYNMSSSSYHHKKATKEAGGAQTGEAVAEGAEEERARQLQERKKAYKHPGMSEPQEDQATWTQAAAGISGPLITEQRQLSSHIQNEQERGAKMEGISGPQIPAQRQLSSPIQNEQERGAKMESHRRRE